MKSNTTNNYSLQRLLPAQWEDYKSIRLEALQTNPAMFGSNYGKESAYTQKEWMSFLENDRRAVFALYAMEALIGLTAVTLDKDEETNAILFASFIKPEYRGKGLTKLFYQARIEWAQSKNCASVTVSHRAGNEISKSSNQRFGFKYVNSKNVAWPDGVYADELFYSLQL